MTKLNNLQLIASCINGHNPFEDESGAICDYYYELETEEEKIQSIKDYGMHADVIKKISDEEAKLIYNYLEQDAEFTGSNDRFYAFKKLGQ